MATLSSSPAIPAGPTGSTRGSLEYLSDVAVPAILDYLQHQGGVPARVRQARARGASVSPRKTFSDIQNSRKARVGGLGGLRDPAFMARKAEAENELHRADRELIPRPKAACGAAWERIALAQKTAARTDQAI